MKCQSCRDALTALMDGELSTVEEETVRSHLSACTACNEEYRSLRVAYDLTSQIDSISLNPEIWTGIRDSLEQEEEARRWFGWLTRHWKPAIAAAGAFGLIGVLFLSVPDGAPDPNLEREFREFIRAREEISRQNRQIFFQTGVNQSYRRSNPFSRPVSFEGRNPFQE